MEETTLFAYIGEIGLYQCLLYTLVCVQAVISSITNLGINFYGAYQDHWCHIDRLSNFPHDIQKLVAIPYSADDAEQYDTCTYYVMDYVNMTDAEIWEWNRTDVGNATTASCDAWVYDQTDFVSTINSQYNLVCDRAWMSAFVSTAYMFGMMVSSILSGFISDRFGRYKLWMVAIFGNFAFALAQAYAPNYVAFVLFRFLMSTFNYTAYLCGYVMVAEFLGKKYRTNFGIGITASGAIGIMLSSGFGYAVRDHKLNLIVGAAQIAALIPLIWVAPESPRWLIARRRHKDAEKVLRIVTAVNNREFPNEIKWDTKDDDKPVIKLADVFRSRILCKEMALMYLNWFTTSLVYYGLSFNAGAFGDLFMNNFLNGLAELPAYALCMLCMTKGNKRLSNAICLLVGGAFCMSCVLVLVTNEDLDGALTALSTIGKGAISFSFACIYVYSADLFPTPTRHAALGTASVFARVGSMVSPYMGPSMEEIWRPMPTMIFGCLAIFTGGMVFMLPETKGHSLPDTIEEAEFIGRYNKAKRKGDTFESMSPRLAKPVDGADDVKPDLKAGVSGDAVFVNDGYVEDDKRIMAAREEKARDVSATDRFDTNAGDEDSSTRL